MNRLLFLPVAALTVTVGYVGFQLGQPVTETDIITRYAARYVSEAPAGAAMTDCLATPGVGDVRLTVICAHPGGDSFVYPAGPRGGLIRDTGGPDT
ncbi:hypothetical protein SAMN05428995_103441 [Loktanella sp. DSM 29012]|uniref:hypothetical protein n=1 Tax=Loktanella sp. DSM 29012 TaxID=1881056 RepID=UPI0008B53F21|nr:hypothetical protein [Loktanella sp. DSM 29012]SEQ27860.1 hypothetical protein SAMN05428995_103441 [Loktanella sp. DSM 29012]